MSAVRRHRLTVAYDGRPFAGWQSQAGGNTVQDILLAALQSICSEIETVQGSGRTDSGVSADAQIAHFDAPKEWRMNSDEWRKALNAKLPPAIRIFDCDVVDADFHARFSAEGKRYGYRIETGEALPPLLAGLAWHCRGLNLGDAFVSAAALFEGTYDFRAFSANRNDGKDAERDTVRTIFRADVERTGDHSVIIRFEGNGFLYKMVRFLVGSIVYCVEGRFAPTEIEALLQGCVDRKAPFCAPADGLKLEKVFYPESLSSNT